MRIEKSGTTFYVHIEPNELQVASGKYVTYGCQLGSINDRGTIKVSMPAASTPRGYKEAAQRALESVRRELHVDGRLFDREGHKKAVNEAKTGRIIVKYSDGTSSRHHEFSAALKRANQEVEHRLPLMGCAAFFSEGQTSADPHTVIVKNEFGHVKYGNATDWNKRGRR